MESPINFINKLNDFKNKEKFSEERWEERGLNASEPEFCQKMNLIFDEIVIDLIELVNLNLSERKSVLKAGLKKFDKSYFDTEEKEFVCDLLKELVDITDVDINDELNKWLYGNVLTIVQKLSNIISRQKTIAILKQSCTKCGVQLETQIKEKQKGIPDNSWLIGKCNSCGELNLISLEPNIKELKFLNYEWVQSLNKAEYKYDQALTRLEQIKIFKK